MSVQSEINRINGNIADAYDAVDGKGGTLPSVQNSANLPAAIESIPSGGGGGEMVTVTLPRQLDFPIRMFIKYFNGTNFITLDSITLPKKTSTQILVYKYSTMQFYCLPRSIESIIAMDRIQAPTFSLMAPTLDKKNYLDDTSGFNCYLIFCDSDFALFQ